MSLGSTPRAAPPPDTGCRGSPSRGYTPTMTRKPSENPAPPAGRIVAYDALRVLAILTVVAIHTLMPYRSVLPDTAPIRILDDVLHYAVPLFVFISGALVWARPWRGGKGAYREFVAKRLGVIGLPYLAWAALYAVLYVERSADGAAALLRVPGLVASGHIWYHLYFIPMLLTFYLLTPVASRAARWSPETLLAAAYVLRIVAGPVLTHAASGLHPLFGQYATHVLSHLPHMALGAWFALRLPILPRRFTSAWPLMLAGGVISLAAVSARGLPDWPLELQRLVFPGAMAATVVGMALGAIALEPRYANRAALLTRMGSLAFGVYFVHPVLLLLVDAAVDANGGWPWTHWWFTVGVWLAVSAASFGVSDLLARTRPTAWLVGIRPPRR